MLELVRIDGVEYYDTLSKSEYYADQARASHTANGGQALKKSASIRPARSKRTLKTVMTGRKPDGSKMVQNAGKADMRVGMD